jgi:hypothetical protein
MAGKSAPTVPTVDELLVSLKQTSQRIDTDPEFAKSLLDPHPSGNPMNIGPRLPKPEDWAANQIQGATNNADKWLKNTTLPRKNFKEEALKASTVGRYKDSMQKVISEGRWEGGMSNVNETETIATIQAGGSAAYSSGVSKRKAKITRVVNEMYNDRLAIVSQLDSMPTTTDAEREAKMIANKRLNQALGQKRRGK